MYGNRGRNGAYGASMVGGRSRHVLGQAMAEIQAEAEAGDPRAAAMCDAIKAAGCGIPGWRQRQLAPGVQAPCDDLYILPFAPTDGNPIFVNAGVTSKTYVARPQKPFRGERPVAIVLRTGAGAAAILPVIRGGILVGTDPQLAQVGDVPIEFLDRGAFGVRMQWAPAEPGIDISFQVALVGGALAAGETIQVQFAVWGSTWAG